MPMRTLTKSPSLRLRRSFKSLAFGAALVGSFAYCADAEARRRGGVRQQEARRGGQWGVLMGGAACIPGRAQCSRDSVMDGGVTIDGRTRPSFGMGAELGYRFNRFVFLGASYNLGFFDTAYEVAGASDYRRGYQNSVYALVRPILPVWRFDFGLGLGPGFSRQTFVLEGDTKDRDYSQGFSFKIEPTINVFITRRVFLGAKLDLLLNAHGRTCRQRGNMTTCNDTESRDLAPVHQMIFGLHVGGTFL
jgi:hypothetical protein